MNIKSFCNTFSNICISCHLFSIHFKFKTSIQFILKTSHLVFCIFHIKKSYLQHESELKRLKTMSVGDESKLDNFDKKFIDFCRWLDKIETNLALSIEDLSQNEQLESYEVMFLNFYLYYHFILLIVGFVNSFQMVYG